MGHLLDWLARLPPAWILVAAGVLPMLESSAFVGIVFPGETAVLLAGVAAHQGAVPLWAVIVVASVGAIIGDSIGYEVGSRYGEQLLARLPNRLISPERVERAKGTLRRHSARAVILGRFTATLRVLVPGLAGMSRVRYRSFLASNAAGAVVWAVVAAVVGYVAGAGYRAAASRLSVIGLGVLAVLVAAMLLHLLRRRPRVRAWLDARTDPARWTGRPLTVTIIVAGAAAWVFAGVTQDVVGQDGTARYDPRIHDWCLAHRTALLDGLARVITYLGFGPIAYAALAVAAVFVLRRTRRWREPLIAVGALVVGQLIRVSISDLVHRARPPRTDWLTVADGYSYPSGHTTTSTLAYGLVVALLLPYLAGRARRAVAIAFAATIAVAVGVSRVWLGVHWPTDVLGGWTLGTLMLTLAATALSISRRRAEAAARPPRRGSAAGGVGARRDDGRG